MQNNIEKATTDYVEGQTHYQLPQEAYPKISVMVYNAKKNKEEFVDYEIVLVLNRKKLKTDKTISVYYGN